MFTEEEKEDLTQCKNNCVREILVYLENNTTLLNMDFVKYKNTRNVIRYNVNRLLNQFFRLCGEDVVVKLRREHEEVDGNRT
jgi:hypothetical protein